MCHKALNIYENYESYAPHFANLADVVAKEYDWDVLTETAFKSLQNRLKI
jgi:hypothetical protein